MAQEKNILILEDDSQIQILYKYMLPSYYQLLITDSISEAKHIVESNRIDCIILDLYLGNNKSGLDLSKKIRKDPKYREIPIIVVTAHAFSSDRQTVLDAGCDDYISKPIDQKLLLKKLDEQMGS